MRFVLLLSLLFIIVLIFDRGESWGRRRRRRRSGRRRRSWLGKTVSKVVSFHRRNKSWINPLAKAGWSYAKRRWGKDSQNLVNLATLKTYDQESYDEFMEHVRDTLIQENPEEDTDLIIEALDQLADMQPEELELFKEDHDADANGQIKEDELSRDLAARVSALNVN